MRRLLTLSEFPWSLNAMALRMPFDPDAFMSATVDQPLEIERTLVPEGEFRMMVDDFDSTAFETFSFTYKRGPNAGSEGSMTKFSCPIVVDDDKVRQLLQMDKPRVFHTCTLDFDETTGQLMFGPNRNIDLGKLRHAVGQNSPGPWSVSQLRGAGPFMGKVKHREGNRKDGSKFKIAEIERMSPIR